MAVQIVNSDPRYGPPHFVTPPQRGYLYVAASVAPPSGPPFVRSDVKRSALLDLLRPLAAELRAAPGVAAVTVFRADLLPPAPRGVRRPARYDVAVLVETSSVDALGGVAEGDAFARMRSALEQAATDTFVMPARCARSLGDVDESRDGVFLFNHFASEDPDGALELWEHLAGWYVAETGLDNSTLLQPLERTDYVLVNHARWDKSLLRLALEQFARRSFHRYVRGNLRANHTTAMPGLYRRVAA